jgi:NDP-sugar pyrophosphorylase family protein
MKTETPDLTRLTQNFQVLMGTALPNPWELTDQMEEFIRSRQSRLDAAYRITNGVAIHRTAEIEEHVILKGPVIIGDGAFIAAHAYLRGGVFIGPGTVIGPGTEVKSSVILNNSSLAHFNFAGNSIIGSYVNMEAGSVIANHYNEREDKTIWIHYEGQRIRLNTQKFGAVVGDHSRIGANAVLSPGTILPARSVVARLRLVDQAEGLT